MITATEVMSAFATLEYERDRRRPPDEYRRQRFRSGWSDALRPSDGYADSTLKSLTWQNLGYRLGIKFGQQTIADMELAYDTLAAHYTLPALLPAPTATEYAAAFRKLDCVTDTQLQMLRIHYHSPAFTITATALASAIGYSHHVVVNSVYGRLAGMVGDRLDYSPTEEQLGTLVTFEKRSGTWHWIMRPEVAEALNTLGWVESSNILLPEEMAATTTHREGAVYTVLVNVYERNPQARSECLSHYGYNCVVCLFNFETAYGDVGKNFIHVHHLTPVSQIGKEYVVDPVRDLCPVCPNCHAIIHRRIPPYEIAEVQRFFRRQASETLNTEAE